MFEWLEDELSTIKNRKFHSVRGLAPVLKGRLKDEIDWPVPPPTEYRAFLESYGSAFLCRLLDNWQIRIFDRPTLRRDRTNTDFLVFGGYGSNRAMFHLYRLTETGDSPVYDDRGLTYREKGSFSKWLAARAATARRQYTKKEWRQIVAGPAPFTPEEERIVEARSKYKWRKVGVTPDGKLLVEITNESDMILPSLRFDVILVNRDLVGATGIPVSSLAPGETQVFADLVYCRISHVDEVDMELAPDPWPEDREWYSELRKE